MNRGVDHQPIFFCDADRIELGARLADIHHAFDVATLAYCLMGNHFHLVLRAPDGVLPEAMHHLTSTYSRRLNARLGRDGPLFRGRYHSIPVETEAYLLWVTRYVHRNPLDIAGVRSPRSYRWSSYRAYLGLRPCPAFLDRRPVLDLVGGRVEELASLTEDHAPVRSLSVGDLSHLIRCAAAVDDLRADAPERQGPSIDRTILVLLAERATEPHLAGLIRDALGPCTDADPGRASRRAGARLDRDPRIARALRWVEQQLAA